MSASDRESATNAAIIEGEAVSAQADEWTTVSEDEVDETKIVFDTIGDTFIGTYIGHRVVETEDGKFTQYRFKVGDEIFFTNAGYSLMRGMSKVPLGAETRLQYASDRDTGQESPMRIMRVDIKKKGRAVRK